MKRSPFEIWADPEPLPGHGEPWVIVKVSVRATTVPLIWPPPREGDDQLPATVLSRCDTVMVAEKEPVRLSEMLASHVPAMFALRGPEGESPSQATMKATNAIKAMDARTRMLRRT